MLPALRSLILDEDPENFARAVYGPDFRRHFRAEDADKPAQAVRVPIPDDIAAWLRPVLSGVYAHDGRERASDVRSAWWDLTGAAPSPTSADQIAGAVFATVRVAHAEALEDHADAVADARVADRIRRLPDGSSEIVPRDEAPASLEAARARVRSASLRVAVLGGLLETRRRGKGLEAAVHSLRGSLPLPAQRRDDLARDWLLEVLDLGVIVPDHLDRIATADVHAAGAPLALRPLFEALDRLLGARVPASRPTHWNLSNLTDESTQENDQ